MGYNVEECLLNNCSALRCMVLDRMGKYNALLQCRFDVGEKPLFAQARLYNDHPCIETHAFDFAFNGHVYDVTGRYYLSEQPYAAWIGQPVDDKRQNVYCPSMLPVKTAFIHRFGEDYCVPFKLEHIVGLDKQTGLLLSDVVKHICNPQGYKFRL